MGDLPSSILAARGLSKTFSYYKKRENGGWFATQKVVVPAVVNLDLSVSPGERIAFVGPNGAGKSTSIKMFSGILTPSQGELQVCGLDPTRERRKLGYRIGCVFGQRSQLLPNLPARDTFRLFGRLYDRPAQETEQRIAYLADVFALGDFIDQPVRQLSLGQRMRGEIVASLIHRPAIIFLDEPTIGLDVVAKRALRDTLLRMNAEEGTTIFLTSHDAGDIEHICTRMVVIDHGRVIVDDDTARIKKTFLNRKTLHVDYEPPFDAAGLVAKGFSVTDSGVDITIDASRQSLNDWLAEALKAGTVADLRVSEGSLEDAIVGIYTNKPAPEARALPDTA